jgi:hypothetical protein
VQEYGKTYELIVRSGTNHIMTEWRIERDAQAIDWFKRHIRK